MINILFSCYTYFEQRKYRIIFQLCINPLYLCLPPTFVCSFTFIFPVSTAPNAIAYDMAKITTIDMFKVGWLMNILTVGVTIGCTLSYGVLLFDLNTYPDWAKDFEEECKTNASLHLWFSASSSSIKMRLPTHTIFIMPK